MNARLIDSEGAIVRLERKSEIAQNAGKDIANKKHETPEPKDGR